MMSRTIKNSSDLREEIMRLKGVEKQQSDALIKRVSSLSGLFSAIVSIFPGPNAADGSKGFFEQDIVGLLSRILLPFTLNKTIFRHSNLLVKAFVGYASQKASHLISEDSVAKAWHTIKNLFKTKESEIPEHRAIPALSETS